MLKRTKETRNGQDDVFEIFWPPQHSQFLNGQSSQDHPSRMTFKILAPVKNVTTENSTDVRSRVLRRIEEAAISWLFFGSYVAGKAQMYFTDMGFIGIGLGDIREGDVVALLGNEPCPVILPSGRDLFESQGFTDHHEVKGFTYIPAAEYLPDEEFHARELNLRCNSYGLFKQQSSR